MSREALGNFELMVLLAILKVGENAYGVPIADALHASSGHDVLMGSVYAALERLQTKGFVSSSLGEPTQERGGRAKRYFSVTTRGLKQVRDAHRALTSLWQGLPQVERARS